MSGISPEQRQRDAETLKRIRREYADVREAQWLLTDDGQGMIVDAKQPNGEIITLARFNGIATPEEMALLAFAPKYIGFLLGLLDQAFAKIRQLQAADAGAKHTQSTENSRQAKDHTTEVVMICQRGDFRQFLADCHGLEAPLTYDRATQRLRSVLRIKSRTELNEDDDAAARWKQLRAAFETWKRG